MSSVSVLRVGFFVVAAALAACQQSGSDAETVSFAKDVQPILDARCVECHNVAAEGVAMSGLNLSDYESVMSGTRLGPMVVPNSAESSSLYLVVAQETNKQIHMPPHHDSSRAEGRGTPLSEQQIATIKAWIDQGALNN